MSELDRRETTNRVYLVPELSSNPAYLLSIIASAMDAIITIDSEQRIMLFNHAAEQMFGYTAQEMLGESVQALLPERYRQRHAVQIERFGESGVTNRSMGRLGTLYGLRANGDEFPIEASISKIVVNGALHYTVILRDVTERVQAEAQLTAKTEEIKTMTRQLWQTAKLATMGELAASIAHELNNPLAILSLRIESRRMQLPADDPVQRELSIMEQEVERMAGLVQNLLQFSRTSDRQLSTLDLQEEVEKTLELMSGHLANRQILVEREYAADAPMVIVDRQQMRQLFLNLISNAADSMAGGGVLTIRIAPTNERTAVQVEVQDTGAGILPEHMDQLTEPFFTTKQDGSGAGLGLAICRRIVEEHSGALEITSPGKDQGATVRVVLPVNGSRVHTLQE
jgi:PAS domain S-box-containing protein